MTITKDIEKISISGPTHDSGTIYTYPTFSQRKNDMGKLFRTVLGTVIEFDHTPPDSVGNLTPTL